MTDTHLKHRRCPKEPKAANNH